MVYFTKKARSSEDTESCIADYHSLTPTDDAEKIDAYSESLEWALQNRKQIKNVAITGSYGYGKSSFIKTFEKKNKSNDEYRFLNISLATFSNCCEKKKDNKTKYTDQGDEQQSGVENKNQFDKKCLVLFYKEIKK